MGTLDDAIREHLELKRKHGADEVELKELEDSAFGPPERPGADGGEGQPAGSASAAAGAGGAETTLMPAEGVVPAAPASGEQAAAASQPAAGPEATESEADRTPAEQAREDYPHLDDTISHEPIAPPEKVQSTEEQDALEISLFESEDDEEDFDIGEIDLELGDEDGEAAAVEPFEPETEEPVIEAHIEEAAAAAPSEEPMIEAEAGEGALEPPEDSAREHELIPSEQPEPIAEIAPEPAAEAVIDPDPTDEGAPIEPAEDVEPVEDVEAVEEAEQPPAHQQIVDPDPTEEGHDVLEETPEFLRDAPESDEMWFEQDQPKDFDFDDD